MIAENTVTPTSSVQQTSSLPITVTVSARLDVGEAANLTVKQGEELTFRATGIWCWGNNSGSEADGSSDPAVGPRLMQNEPVGKLIGRIEGYPHFAIGSANVVTATQSGELLLMMNDVVGTHENNIGSLDVTISEEGDRFQPIVTSVPARAGQGHPAAQQVIAGDVLHFRATGTWCRDDGSDPNGTTGRPSPEEEPATMLRTARFGMLLGRIMRLKNNELVAASDPFPIGKQQTVPMPADGELFLLMNDRKGTYGNNFGRITVTISSDSP